MAKKRRTKNNKNKKWLVKKRETRRRKSFFSFNFGLPQEIQRWIFGVIMFLVAIIIAFSFFNIAGSAGEFLRDILLKLIGKATYFLPLFFVAGGIVLFGSKYKNKFPVFLGVILSILGIAGIWGTFSPQESQGGLFGRLMSQPLTSIFGPWLALIIFSVVIIIGVIILWHLLGYKREKLKDEKKKDDKEEPSLIKKVFTAPRISDILQGEPKFKVNEIEPSIPSPNEIPKPELSLKKQPLIDLSWQTSVKNSHYQIPPLDLLERDRGNPMSGDIKINSAIIKRTLQNFDIQVEMSEISIGPTVTQYTLKPAEGVKLSKIIALNNDLSLALAAHPIRIEAPIPGRPLVGIEIPNKSKTTVRLRNLLEHPTFQNSPSPLMFVLGRDVAGNPMFADLARMPHLLVAGSTGTGKTICLNNIILSLLYRNSPDILKLILIDPKRVEFPVYNDIPHLLTPVIVDSQRTLNALKWVIGEMERRFGVLSEERARDIGNYNESMAKRGQDLMPYIVVIIDELADLMASRGREMEAGIVRLAQMARAVGIHLIVATQRPSVEVITGLIKANITSRITFQVASQVDSRTVLDMAGAEKLLGAGDMLFISAEISKPKRVQGSYISEKEVKRVAGFIAKNKKEKIEVKDEAEPEEELKEDILPVQDDGSDLAGSLEKTLDKAGEFDFSVVGDDPLYEEAKRVVVEARKASASLLQRRLRIGYARAARLIDSLEERKIIGPGEGAKPREVYIDNE